MSLIRRVVAYGGFTSGIYQNLAAEECILRSLPRDEVAVMVYRNTPCVVIGRNQNQWLECDVAELDRRGVPWVRRHSGGGTVWHDLGNACFSVATPRPLYSPARSTKVAVAAMRRLGVPLDAGERHDLWYEGKKVTGSAFRVTSSSAYHHGTLLIDADLDSLNGVLRPRPHAKEHMRSHGVGSVGAEVTNLRPLFPDADLSDEAILSAFAEAAAAEYEAAEGVVRGASAALCGSDKVLDAAAEVAGDGYRLGVTPSFTYRLQHETESDSGIDLDLKVVKGSVKTADCRVWVGACDLPRTSFHISDSLGGVRYAPACVVGAVESAEEVAEAEASSGYAVREVLTWLRSVF